MQATRPTSSTWIAQAGYSLIELSVAILVALFLLAGVLTVVQNNGLAFRNENQIGQMQDGARLAMTMISDVIQIAGYFPDPTSNTATSMLTAVAPFAAGQAISGTYGAAAPGDTVAVRYSTASGDGILSCNGSANTTGGIKVYVNVFSVTGGQLVCAMNGTQYPLVAGIQKLSVLYGVKTNLAVDDNNADTYLRANEMTAANWGNVISVRFTLTFNNPLYVAAGQGQPQTLTFERVVDVMGRTGLKV
jgi:type IV pilus assembly protein PilW